MRRTGSSWGEPAEVTDTAETRDKTVKIVTATTLIAEGEKEGEKLEHDRKYITPIL
jgi:hypothetical protein